jgi:ABC-type molybdenum transport system ATPase subunit/photorepair protein PhrA
MTPPELPPELPAIVPPTPDAALAEGTGAAPRVRPPPLLEVDQIDVFYDDVQVLHGLRLEIRQGEIVTLLGSNGAG